VPNICWDQSNQHPSLPYLLNHKEVHLLLPLLLPHQLLLLLLLQLQHLLLPPPNKNPVDSPWVNWSA
jgi:hypothetical protein